MRALSGINRRRQVADPRCDLGQIRLVNTATNLCLKVLSKYGGASSTFLDSELQLRSPITYSGP